VRGHEQILDMRRNGLKPAFVWLQDGNSQPTDNAVTIAKTDMPEALDLRFLVGTVVLAESSCPDRLERITAACINAKASRVIANLFDEKNHFETIKTTDTAGETTWQK